MERFARLIQLVGPEAVTRLEAAEVAVFGLGAVGGFAVEALARAGIGTLRLVDFDVLQSSNLNRQLLALHSTLGRPKIEIARHRVADINPACRVDARGGFVDADTATAFLDPPPDVVIDAIDGVNSKVNLLAAAHGMGIFTVSSMGAACRLDPTRVRVADLADTEGCPLARVVRKRLGRRGIRGGIRCVFSTEPPRPSQVSVPAAVEETSRGRQRPPLGSISYLPAIFGLFAAAEAIRWISREK
ncbi:MAG: tRNA threonylcarbamoyladenosine dehydratase [Desulfobacterales bacterium]|nr:tRNA threonylcarbamoyladenosine dehydratase [Desulfobacteraceae bacterium]MDY0312999.1 tRNA threonylcarbamoyladenosine dehydratase [Desulfobacterales bacterium]